MTSQSEKALRFRSMHVPGDPLVLYNIWDAGSAQAVARAGARAIATSSWSIAAAQGHEDGQRLPLPDALATIARICACVALPVSVDFEAGYAADPETVGSNAAKLFALGAVALNFEDQVVDGPGLYRIDDQVARLRAIRHAADAAAIPVFINARTDVFLKAAPGIDHAKLLDDAIVRQAAYADAGADGYFVPGLVEPTLIEALCRKARLPINIMMSRGAAQLDEIAALGVSRISFGPAPYIDLTSRLARDASAGF